MKTRKLVAIFVLVITSTIAYSQKGTIRGTVFDGSTGETLVGVSVVVKDTFIGTATDLDGKFALNVEPGTYDLQLSFISFQPLTVEGVEVNADDVTVLNNLELNESTVELKDVVVTARAIRNTEAALQTMKKKSSVMLDGISAARIELIGDGTAVEAAKRVTGVTVEEGKYVYVRGLGDRYSKTTLNNLDIPGLDPDRNSLQMDIFPTNIIDNMMVSKNFTADLPADFTGGLMNVSTKDFPDRKRISVSVSTSYNPQSNLNSDFLTYDGGDTDFLGFDDGTRALPSNIPSANSLLPTPSNGSNINNFVNSFSPTLGAKTATSFLNYSAGISMGNQIDLNPDSEKAPKLGYIFSMSYKSEYDYDDEVVFGDYKKVIDETDPELIYSTLRNGAVGEKNVLIGVLGGLAYKTNFNKIRLTAMHLQNGTSTAGQFNIDNNGDAIGQSGYTAPSDRLQYNQRSLTNVFLNGTHVFEDAGWELDWRISPTFSISDDPDIRKIAFTENSGGQYEFLAGAAGYPSRTWRELSEINNSARVDLTKDYTVRGEDAKLKVGVSHNYKTRDYEITKMGYQLTERVVFGQADPSLFLRPENIYDGQNGFIYMIPESSESNAYEANVNNLGFYASNEFYALSKLKTIVGLRVENYVMRHTGQSQDGTRVLDNDKVLDSFDFFPTISFIYELKEDQNLRASFSRTIARPSFKEMSFAQIIDPISNSIFNGGLYEVDEWDGNLKETHINNFDFRWEKFWDRGQNISASVFYKDFTDPIELVRITKAKASTEYQPRNVGEGELMGVEFEFSKNMDLISPALENFNFNGNVTLTRSEVTMTDAEYQSRKEYGKEGQSIDKTRNMAGQSPYVINAGISYNNIESGLSTGLFYNVKGETLSIVGGDVFPDFYTSPFHSLNFSLNKKFGEEKRTKIDFKVSNILGQSREYYFKSYEATDQLGELRNPGRSFSIGLSYKF